MEPTTLRALLDSGAVELTSNGLRGVAQPAWIVAGEDRLSYTTLVRLIECCREHHWNADIAPLADAGALDSITKSLNATFLHPVLAGSPFTITYEVGEVRTRAYRLRFAVEATGGLCAVGELVSVFYDPAEHAAVAAPPAVRDRLLSLARRETLRTRP